MISFEKAKANNFSICGILFPTNGLPQNMMMEKTSEFYADENQK